MRTLINDFNKLSLIVEPIIIKYLGSTESCLPDWLHNTTKNIQGRDELLYLIGW
jgi:hypothetical protein